MPAAPAEIPETSDERFANDVEFLKKYQTEGDPGTEVDQDMVVYPKQVLPKNAEPTMPSEEGIPDPKFRQIELAVGGRVELAEGVNPNAIMDANEGAIKTAKEWYTKFAPQVTNDIAKGAMMDANEGAIKTAKEWYEKHAPQVTNDIAKGASKTLRVIGTPAVSAALYVEDVYSDLKKAAMEGNVTASKTLDAIVGKGEKGLYFMLPELAKDVVTNPIVSKMLQLGSLGRVTNPVGAALTAVGVGKNVYDQYQEFKSLPEEQKQMLKKQFTYDQDPGQTTAIENTGREGAAVGGRIGYANGSEDDNEVPTLSSEEEFFGKSVRQLPKEGIRGVYYGVKDTPREAPTDPITGQPMEISGSSIKELKQYLASRMPEQRPEIGYRDENFSMSASKGVSPFTGTKRPMYEASYTPNQDVGTFSVNKGPGYLGANYGREDLGNVFINKTGFTTEAGYNYDKDNLGYGIQALVDKFGNKEVQGRIKYKF
jgi:hypothetical protein